jgi:hypothetical protein
MPYPLERHEDELGQRTCPEARPTMMNMIDTPRDLQNTTPRESAGSASGLSHAMGHGLRSLPGVQRFGKLGPPLIGWALS